MEFIVNPLTVASLLIKPDESCTGHKCERSFSCHTPFTCEKHEEAE